MARSPIEIEDTPNPHAMKFIADRPFAALTEAGGAPRAMRSYRSIEDAEAAADALATAVFAAGPIVSVMIVADFVTVNKKPSARWARLQPKVEEAIQQYLDG
ncbi:MAG: NifU N-terminal domain-containing protein [Planctomycetota bacterium]